MTKWKAMIFKAEKTLLSYPQSGSTCKYARERRAGDEVRVVLVHDSTQQYKCTRDSTCHMD